VRAIVTGGAGFIGSHVVDTLIARDDEVVVLDDLSHGKQENVHPGAELVVADIRDRQAVEEVFRESRPKACLHLAAQADVRVSIARPDFDGEVNVLGTIRLLEAARAAGVPIVFTTWAYDPAEPPSPHDAKSALRIGPGHALHVGDQVAEALPDHAPDVGVVAGRVALELGPQDGRIVPDQLSVGLAHRLERLLAPLALGRALERFECEPQAALRRGNVKALLRPEQSEKVRLGDARAAGDLVRRRTVQAAGGEFLACCLEDRLSPLLSGLPCGRGNHPAE